MPSESGQRNDQRYVVITPARNEAANLGATIDSMKRQTVVPLAWYIVDDGSTDETPDMVRAATVDSPWIHLVQRDDRGFRAAGGGVVEAVQAGYDLIEDHSWDFLVKLDADLRFDEDYFASCLGAFADDDALGIAGGTVYNLENGQRVSEPHPSFHVRGATKIYRNACWFEIGGLVAAPGWDTIDELSANMHGWSTRTLTAIPIDQLRTTGDAAGQWSNWVKNGRAAYLAGYHPLFLLARAAKRLVQSPYIVATAGLLWGYGRPAIRREPRQVDAELESYVKKQQWNRLTGKETIWR